ncbi:MAG TPA: 3-deoxy-8-phosphooctulonate synthase [Salinivirgaceae bacterium]|nr:3-deoxy-8-phosphooctulonate synthase [Salinivirgaceae bacterium]
MLNTLPHIHHLNENNFFLLAGPCVVEGYDITMHIADALKTTTEKLKIPFVFKASYRKANRSRMDSFSGIGDHEALKILEKVKTQLEVPIITDIHLPEEAAMAAKVADILQIPAFLCRQTDILVAAAKTQKIINIKKGQFIAPESMKFAAQKVVETGNQKIMLTERGTMFGYGDLIVDMRSFPIMKNLGYLTVADITHSLQQPNTSSGVTGGRPDLIETLGRAAIAVGADGIFIETHPDPKNAKSDGANMLQLNLIDGLLSRLVAIRKTVNQF